jgi:RNA 2',3'-cyclic 3'-phosphodiesterase
LSEEELRAFVALELDASVRERLAQSLRERLPPLDGLRLVAADNIHLTLRFLGPSRPAQLQRIQDQLAAAAAASPPFLARLLGAGMFPERGSPRVLWVGLMTVPELAPLQAGCERAARDAGYVPERRPFRPHLTVGRFRERLRERPRLPELALGETLLERLVLFRSELQKERARHTPLASFTLAGRA